MAMSLSARELRTRTAEVFRALREGGTVTLTYRGRPVARIEPIEHPPRRVRKVEDVFGMWRERTDMEEVREWVRAARSRRLDRSYSTRTS